MSVSPTGKSVVESVLSGEADPTVPEFQAARESFFDSFKGLSFLTNRVFWVVVAIVVILVLIAIVKKG